METLLYVPKTGPPPSKPPLPVSPPPPAATPSLRQCPACGNIVSRDAESCWHCGKPFVKTHGVFFYVFWSVAFLIVIGLMSLVLWFLFVVVGPWGRSRL